MQVEPTAPTIIGFKGDVHCAKIQAPPRNVHSLRVPCRRQDGMRNPSHQTQGRYHKDTDKYAAAVLSAETPFPQDNSGEAAVPYNGYSPLLYKGVLKVLLWSCMMSISFEASSRVSTYYRLRWEDTAQIFVLSHESLNQVAGKAWIYSLGYQQIRNMHIDLQRAVENHYVTHTSEHKISLRGTKQPPSEQYVNRSWALWDLPPSEGFHW